MRTLVFLPPLMGFAEHFLESTNLRMRDTYFTADAAFERFVARVYMRMLLETRGRAEGFAAGFAGVRLGVDVVRSYVPLQVARLAELPFAALAVEPGVAVRESFVSRQTILLRVRLGALLARILASLIAVSRYQMVV